MIQLGNVNYLTFVRINLLSKNKSSSEKKNDSSNPNTSKNHNPEYKEEDIKKNNKEIEQNKSNRIIIENKNFTNQSYQNL